MDAPKLSIFPAHSSHGLPGFPKICRIRQFLYPFLCYFKPVSEHEIEFLIEKNGEVVPIEVKAGNNPTASLNSFIRDYSPPLAYKLTGGRNRRVGVRITLPHYMVMFL